MARVSAGVKPLLKVPYDGAIRAFAYSGMPFATASRIIEVLGFLQPCSGLNSLRTLYVYYRNQARSISPDFKFARGMAESFRINPLYDWVQSGKSKQAPVLRIDSIMDEMRRPLLRKALDLLLFIGWSPVEIADTLNNKVDAPVKGWDAEDVKIYRDFFWDTTDMMLSDWEKYLSWWAKSPMEYANRHVFRILDSSKEEILWMAGIVDSVTPQQMTKTMMLECYMQFRKNSSADQPDTSMMLKHIDAFRKLAVASKVLGGVEDDTQEAARSIMQSITVALKAHDADDPVSREDLDDLPIVVSARESLGNQEHDARTP